MGKVRRSIELIGLDLEFFSEENIIELIKVVEESIKNDLNRILGLRTDEYTITIGVEVNKELRIAIDLDVKAYLSNKMNLHNILNKVINHAFDKTRIHLKQLARKNKNGDPQIREHSHLNT